MGWSVAGIVVGIVVAIVVAIVDWLLSVCRPSCPPIFGISKKVMQAGMMGSTTIYPRFAPATCLVWTFFEVMLI